MRDKIKLGDVCTVVSGTTPKTGNDEYWKGDILWVTPAEITDNTFILNDTVRKITEKAVKESSLKPFPKGTVLLSSRAPIGKVAIAGKEMYCNQGFKNLICNTSLFNEYLYWFLKSKYDFLNSLGRGVTFKEVSKSIVENIEIPLRDIVEQKHISLLMNKCQSIISLRNEQLKYLDDLIKSRFIEMFGDPILNPKGWDMEYLGDICDVRDGTHDSPKYVTDGFPLVTSKNVSSGYIDFSSVNMISEEDLTAINKRSKVDNGDIIMPMIGTVGNPIIVSTEKIFAIKNVALIKFKEKSLVNNVYIKAVLESEYFENAVSKNKRGGTQKFIALGDIRKFLIQVPRLDYQNEFMSFVQHVDKLKISVQKSLDETQKILDLLMQEYFG